MRFVVVLVSAALIYEKPLSTPPDCSKLVKFFRSTPVVFSNLANSVGLTPLICSNLSDLGESIGVICSKLVKLRRLTANFAVLKTQGFTS